ncbi:MAG TPA: HAD-IC family P-type ATPase, partial [Gemmatimonadales bacterium]|nr:HAD-IC family P-type ATPase [Gemmatimonadales bacterium]
ATGVVEQPGQGVLGRVEGREVTLGARSFVLDRHPALAASWTPDGNGGLRAWLAVGDQAAGTIGFADRLHPDAERLLGGLRELGFRRIVMVTGDQASHAEAVARSAGIGEYRSELLPADKVRAVEELERDGEHVLMVGDGTNDAPALSRASVGVALAAHGGGITAEAADAVVLVDDPSRVVEAVAIGRRTVRIARQSVWVGVGLSGLAMIVAALGHIPPTVGALLQEGIDVAVILNALRASGESG